MFDLNESMRPHLRNLQPYSSARNEFYGSAEVWLDANESPYGTGLNRYPDPLQAKLKSRLAELKQVPENQIFVGNGSDEAIDLLIRCFCAPGSDAILICPPTYGMYAVSAAIHNVAVKHVPLNADFSLDMPALNQVLQGQEVKLLFICSPNNPTGSVVPSAQILELCGSFSGVVVVDEAYIDFADQAGMSGSLSACPNLVVLQTLSKAYGLAGIRLGFAFGAPALIELLNKVKPPYNVSTPNQEWALRMLEDPARVRNQIAGIRQRREALRLVLDGFTFVVKVFPSQANFLLAQFQDANAVYQHLIKGGIVVRNRCAEVAGALRISIGTDQEQDKLIAALNQFQNTTK